MSQIDPRIIACRACRQPIDTTGFDPGKPVECPLCHQLTIIDEQNDSDIFVDDSSREDELDGLRIRQIATLRSSAYRSRSHAVIAMLVCVGATIESLAYLLRDIIHFGMTWRTIAPAAIAILGIAGTGFFMRRAVALHREATTPHKADSSSTPDFSTLQDGSQRRRNLDQMR